MFFNSSWILSVLSFIFLSLISNPANAQVAKEGYYIYDTDRQHLSLFANQPEMIVDLVSSKGYELYGPDGLGLWLKTLRGIRYKKLHNNLNEVDNAKLLAEYQTPEQVVEQLKNLQKKYPEIISVFSIGNSVQNRPILAVKISDNVTEDEIEPEFKYIANMHGDEIVGREMLVKLAEEMAVSYNNHDEEITLLINNTEIYFLPSINPDGNAKKQRGNANWTDLNRNFPDFTTSDNQNVPGKRAIETLAVMNFQKNRNFALSANFHDGAVVVNYPWDTKVGDFQLNDLIIELSSQYANNNTDMRNSHEFTNGITNGYDWYEVNGGMQDWSYYWHGDMQITVELSQIKWPKFSEIARQYTLNKKAMLTYITRIHQGAGIYFSNRELSGKISIFKVATNSANESAIGTFGFTHGEFYKVLNDGAYRYEIQTGARNDSSINITVKNELSQNNGNYIFIN